MSYETSLSSQTSPRYFTIDHKVFALRKENGHRSNVCTSLNHLHHQLQQQPDVNLLILLPEYWFLFCASESKPHCVDVAARQLRECDKRT